MRRALFWVLTRGVCFVVGHSWRWRIIDEGGKPVSRERDVVVVCKHCRVRLVVDGEGRVVG